MSKFVVTKQRHHGDQAGQIQTEDFQGGVAGVAIASARPMLRLARRHRLSKARGVVLGATCGLVIWILAAGLIYASL